MNKCDYYYYYERLRGGGGSYRPRSQGTRHCQSASVRFSAGRPKEQNSSRTGRKTLTSAAADFRR